MRAQVNLFPMNKLTELARAQKTVLSRPAYMLLFLLLTPAFAGLFYYITRIPGQSLESWVYSMQDSVKAFIILASPVLALTFTTQAFILNNYRLGMHEAKAGGSAIGALAAGAAAAACCSPVVGGLLAIFGAGAIVIGHESEILAAAFVILAASLYYSSKMIFCSECRVKAGVAARSAAD